MLLAVFSSRACAIAAFGRDDRSSSSKTPARPAAPPYGPAAQCLRHRCRHLRERIEPFQPFAAVPARLQPLVWFFPDRLREPGNFAIADHFHIFLGLTWSDLVGRGSHPGAPDVHRPGIGMASPPAATAGG